MTPCHPLIRAACREWGRWLRNGRPALDLGYPAQSPMVRAGEGSGASTVSAPRLARVPLVVIEVDLAARRLTPEQYRLIVSAHRDRDTVPALAQLGRCTTRTIYRRLQRAYCVLWRAMEE